MNLQQLIQEAAEDKLVNEANTFFNKLVNLLDDPVNIKSFNMKTGSIVVPSPFVFGKQIDAKYRDLIIIFATKKDEQFALADKKTATKFQPALDKYRMVLYLFKRDNFKTMNFKNIVAQNKNDIVENLLVPYLTINNETSSTSKRDQAFAFNELITKVIYFLNHHQPIDKIPKKNFHKYFSYVKKILKERKPKYANELGKLDKKYQQKAVGKLYKNWTTNVTKKKIK